MTKPPTAETGREVIQRLGLLPHPEGGHYRETFRAPAAPGERGAVTLIYYLLLEGEVSHWHRVDAVESWHWYAGAPLAVTISENGHDAWLRYLGPDLALDQEPQLVVPAHAWQKAESLGPWTLVGCAVAPAFRFEGFELAPKDWEPRPRPGRANR
jgi:predicted cupin superfamily sugar epimerase